MRSYVKPSLTEVGSVRDLTEQGLGANFTDVPMSTPINPADPGSFIGVVPTLS